MTNWVDGVAASGTFTRNASILSTLPRGNSAVPIGWTVVPTDMFRLTSSGQGDITITIPAGVTSSNATSLSYSKDNENWTTTTVDSTDQTITIPVNSDDTVYLKGVANQWCVSGTVYTNIQSDVDITASGNIMSILYGDNVANGYQGMFNGCTGLVIAPNLPATTLANACYSQMFMGCSSLTTGPQTLPGTNAASECYSAMFKDCVAMTTPPQKISATEFGGYSCRNMFSGCSAMTYSPEIGVGNSSLDGSSIFLTMFQNCSNLSKITFLPKISGFTYGPFNNWVDGVAATGKFYLNEDYTGTYAYGNNAIPANWTAIPPAPGTVLDYFKITALGNGDVTIHVPSYLTSTYLQYISWSKDCTTWNKTAITNQAQDIVISVEENDVVYIIGKGNQWAVNSSDLRNSYIQSTCDINISGNIMSLIYAHDFQNQTTLPAKYTFFRLFKDNTHIIDASNLTLPATNLTQYCYSEMFRGCTGLTEAPAELPATTLADYCYMHMFNGCTSISDSPVIKATTNTATSCCSYMFNGCTGLATITAHFLSYGSK